MQLSCSLAVPLLQRVIYKQERTCAALRRAGAYMKKIRHGVIGLKREGARRIYRSLNFATSMSTYHGNLYSVDMMSIMMMVMID